MSFEEDIKLFSNAAVASLIIINMKSIHDTWLEHK